MQLAETEPFAMVPIGEGEINDLLCLLKGFALARPFCWPIKTSMEGVVCRSAKPTGRLCALAFAVSGDA